MNQYLMQLAVEHGLYLSTGSDFHDAAAHWTDVGKFPTLDRAAAQHGIWHHPIWLAHDRALQAVGAQKAASQATL